MALKTLKEKKSEMPAKEPIIPIVKLNKNGFLEFTHEVAQALGLKDGAPVKFAIDDKDQPYLIVCKDRDNETITFMERWGNYCIPSKSLTDNIEYAADTAFELQKDDSITDQTAYKMIKL